MNLFEDKLRDFICDEVLAHQTDPTRLSVIIEQLAFMLGMTISIASEGDPKHIDRMIAACEQYAHSTAVRGENAIRKSSQQSS